MNLYSPRLKPLTCLRPFKLPIELIPSFASSSYDRNTQSLLTPSTLAQDSQRSGSDRRKILNFNEFLSNCEDLHKDVNGLSSSIEKSLSCKIKKKKVLTTPINEIRNKDYFDGIKRIEEKLRIKKQNRSKDEFRSLKSLMSPGAPGTEQFITFDDVSSVDGANFLAGNKRGFGRKLQFVKECEIEKEKEKDKEREKVMEKEEEGKGKGKGKKRKKKRKLFEYLKEGNGIRLKNKRRSMPSLGNHMELTDNTKAGNNTDSKNRLPVLDLARMIAIKAKNDANRFFVDQKLINNRVLVKRRSIFNLNLCK